MLKSTRVYGAPSPGADTEFSKRGVRPAIQWRRARERGGGTYVPGRRVEGGRNRREIINYRVNERTHGQIQGAVAKPYRVGCSYYIRLSPPSLFSAWYPPIGPGPEADNTPPPNRALNITLRHCRDTKSGVKGGGGG